MVLCCATVHANKATTESVLVLIDVDREMSSHAKSAVCL